MISGPINLYPAGCGIQVYGQPDFDTGFRFQTGILLIIILAGNQPKSFLFYLFPVRTFRAFSKTTGLGWTFAFSCWVIMIFLQIRLDSRPLKSLRNAIVHFLNLLAGARMVPPKGTECVQKPKQQGPEHANYPMKFASPGPVMQESIKYKILKNIADNPKVTQRQLARELDVSLGKANYCLRALIDRGWVKVENFRQSGNKLGYIYKLTPAGLDEKGRVAVRFLKMKMQEYEEVKAEIEALQAELEEQSRCRHS